MRAIGHLDSEDKARLFSDFLVVQKIPNQAEPGATGAWDIWVFSDDDLPKASEFLTAFRANPQDPQFAAAAKAGDLRKQEQKDREQFQKRIRTRDNVFRRFVVYGVGPLTGFLMCACIFVYVWKSFGSGEAHIHWLFFSEVGFKADLGTRLLGSPEIRSGEVWRLITPIFLHFGIIHIFFNMLWLRDLGGMIETVEGIGKFAALVIVSAALSNLAQYVISGPTFGGMSGVVYAMLGYVWMKGKYHPGSGLYLHKETVTMMLIWLVVCFTGWLGPIANWAHLGGLIVGVVWGYVATHRN